MAAVKEIDANLERTVWDSPEAAGLNVHLDDLEQLGSLVSRDLGRKLKALIRRSGVAEPEFLLPSSPSALFVLISAGYGYTASTKEVRLDSPTVFQVTAADAGKWVTIQHKEVRDQSRINVNGEIVNIRKQVDTSPTSVLTIEDVETPTIEAFLEANPDKLVLGKIDAVDDTPGSESVTLDISQDVGHRFLLLATDDEKVSKNGDNMNGHLVFKNDRTLFSETTGPAYRDNVVFSGEDISAEGGATPAPSDAKSLRQQFFATGSTKKYRLFDKQFSKSVFEYDGFDSLGSTLQLMDNTLELSYVQGVAKKSFIFEDDVSFRSDIALWREGAFTQYTLLKAVAPDFNFVLRQQVGSNNVLVNEQHSSIDNTVYLGGNVDSGVRPNQVVTDAALTNSMRLAGSDFIRLNGTNIFINRIIRAEAFSSLTFRNNTGSSSIIVNDNGTMSLLSIGVMNLNGQNLTLSDIGANAQLGVKTGGSLRFSVGGVVGMTLDLNDHLDLSTVGSALLKSRRNVRMAAGKRVEFGNIDVGHVGAFIDTVSDAGNLRISHVGFPNSIITLGATLDLTSNSTMSFSASSMTLSSGVTSLNLASTTSMSLVSGTALVIQSADNLELRRAGIAHLIATGSLLFLRNATAISLTTNSLRLETSSGTNYPISNGNSVRQLVLSETGNVISVGTPLETDGTLASTGGARIVFGGLSPILLENRTNPTTRNFIEYGSNGITIGHDVVSNVKNINARSVVLLQAAGSGIDYAMFLLPYLIEDPNTSVILGSKGGVYVVNDGVDIRMYAWDGSTWKKSAAFT